jgi:cyclic pyranopterin phosphate synthase
MLTHIDEKDQPRMVDVSQKKVTRRTALAESCVRLPKIISDLFDGQDIQTKKGAVFQTAIIAGIMASKRTHELIPMCHPLGLENCHVEIAMNDQKDVIIRAEVAVTHKTGVEMEALTAASVAALTIYDMCKGMSHEMVIDSTRLILKTGGKSDVRLA